MGETAEHDMAHLPKLPFYGGIQSRMVIAVYGCPPRTHAIDQFAAVFQIDAYSLGPLHGKYGQWIYSRCIGMPKVVAIQTQHFVNGHSLPPSLYR